METIYINDKKLEKYQDLFFYAAKFCGRLILQNKGSHANLQTACSFFEKEYSKVIGHKKEVNFTPLSGLFDLLINFKKMESWDIYEQCQEFFNHVVYEVSKKEKINIQYHFIVGENCLYGVYRNKDKIREPYENYILFLLENEYSLEDIESYLRISKFEKQQIRLKNQ